MDIKKEILEIAEQKNALIIAHNYQNPGIQDIAHFTGDSLELARRASSTDADIIVFCGVHFMAEAASILSPEKKVILPVADAGCPMADMAEADDLLRMKKQYPDAAVVTYINSSAAVKAVSDVICTSSNALAIVEKIDADRIIFVPDKNLGNYVQRYTDKEIIYWKGFCPTHEQFTLKDLKAVKEKYPDAMVVSHPECRPEVVDASDRVFSTGGMVKFVENHGSGRLIIATETGMLHRLKKANPDVELIPASADFICPNMKKIDYPILKNSLIQEKEIITVDPDIASLSKKALDRMLELSE